MDRTHARRCLTWLSVVFATSLSGQAVRFAQGADGVNFSRDIRPILANRCFSCHGPDTAQRKAGLRLDVRASATAPAESGETALVPGQPDSSELIRRIVAAEGDERMPPPETKKTLSAREKQLLRQWVADGAPYSEHWSFHPPQRPQVPAVRQASWPRNVIDPFVLARLEQQNLQPSAPANRRTLIRRVSFDLTGLPPTPAEVEAFVNDRTPAAYEQLVDRLLASPRYGERMAMLWLDLARYADSDGYHDDTTRAMWPYRDYVIQSFNDNKRFDQFTIEQIAGDQLPNATVEQKMGTAFLRNGPTSSEVGADVEEYRVKYAVDRVNATATVWLGLTMQCTECHDHKFDPLTQKEFYKWFAFFDQVPGPYLFRGADAPPSIPVTSIAHQAQQTKLDRRLAELASQIAATSAGGRDATALWQQVTSLTQEHGKLDQARPKLRVMQDAPERIPTYLLVRGDFRHRGERVEPGVPSVLGNLPGGNEPPRLRLARWLVAPSHPLVARVTVNRFWALLFGTGLVSTVSDFGSQGEWPSHPELLDWLAVEFIESGWDVKHLLKLMALSATYQQSSSATLKQIERDPQNRHLARGPRQRLSAEMIRDQALAVAGLLQEQIGGPSVRPYQPPRLWEEMSYGGSSDKAYVQDHGANLYRRGLYTFWKRSILYPSFAVFDAANRESSVCERPITNTPLQALVLLNDVTYVEAARVFAEQILKHGGNEDPARIDYAFRRALARRPEKSERSALAQVLSDMRKHYTERPAEAQTLVSAGEYRRAEGCAPIEHAAWTAAAQVILNLDETITKQ